MRRGRRTLSAAILLAGVLGVLLVAWFLAGWADVEARQLAARTRPGQVAAQRGVELAAALRTELAGVIAREAPRPYFHYQNLFHDPRGTARSVAPSPLAEGAPDPLVLGYFQVDAAGKATTPTINDDLPQLSEPTQLADNAAFRDEVARSLAKELTPQRREPAQVAQVAQAAQVAPVEPRPARPARRPREATAPPQATQVIELDPSSYATNSYSNYIFDQQRGNVPAVGIRDTSAGAAAPTPRPARVPRPAPAPPERVTVVVSPLAWHTQTFAGAPALVATRRVDTPDGPLAQGFVIDPDHLRAWIAARAGDAVVELRHDAAAAGTEIAPGWQLAARAHPRDVAAAAAAASSLASGFLIRFVAIGALVALVAGLVVWLVARAERLAYERSQFAAAAAHELRTPLAGLQLYGDMLADGLGDPAKQRDYARRMAEEAARLGRVVSNVLGFSQLERGNLSVEPRPARVDEALRELAERAEPALDRAGAALELDVAAELTARFDRDALARIVGNLLDNAEKYARGADDRTIQLSARAAGDAVEVVVADRGPGITSALSAALFRPFARGASADAPAGLGLGLALSRSLARAMGGDLVHRPADGGGAAFVLRLPRA